MFTRRISSFRPSSWHYTLLGPARWKPQEWAQFLQKHISPSTTLYGKSEPAEEKPKTHRNQDSDRTIAQQQEEPNI
jgi:hypothetical protein